ncbi:MAG: sodium ion-translocating decarboxylase subunit beta [Chloroflexota bacterium]|nr:sodium ion-translocating decarboxylase subunit beta [Chloroflexota bacterium]
MDLAAGEFLGFLNLSWQTALMLVISGVLMWLGIAKKVEPVLLVPIGVGCMLSNIPLSGAVEAGGFLAVLREAGIHTEIFPLLIFIGIGAMIDFEPFLQRPYTILLGAAAQFGIFGTFFLAYLLGAGWLNVLDFSLQDAAAIGIIGSADGPTSIYVATMLQSKYTAAIVVAAYSYMAMVPLIQPPIIKAMCSKEERALKMTSAAGTISQRTKILFPIVTILVVGLITPKATPLIGCLMFGNLLRECGVVNMLAQTAQNELANIVTILLGITVGGMMAGAEFLKPETILVFILGIVAFSLDTVAGVLLGKLMCRLSRGKINPMIGACGISAFPMSARVIQKLGLEANPHNHLLMPAAGANVAGQIASVVAGGVMLMLVPIFA